MSAMPHHVICRCQHCDGHIEFETNSVGEAVACPHCGLETKLYIPQTPLNKPPKPANQSGPNTSPQDVNVEIQRGNSPLGIAGLVLGIISCVFCWIPLLGLVVAPLALIGLLLAIVGLIMAGVSKKTGIAFPISGGIVCLVSLFVTFAITGGFATAFQKAAANKHRTNQEAESKSTNQVTAIGESWATSRSVKQGDIAVSVTRVAFKTFGSPVPPESVNLQIELSVSNLSTTKKVDFLRWSGGDVYLTDNFQNHYKYTDEGGGRLSSIYPQKTSSDTIEFEPPVENVKWLHLELAGENFGGSGMIRFEIPMAGIMAATKEVRSASQDYWALKGGHLNPDPVRLKPKSDRLEAAILRLEAAQKGAVVSP
jgi:hypothetical protein